MSQIGPTSNNIRLTIIGPHYQFQQNRLVGPALQYGEGAAAVGYDGKCVNYGGRDCAGMGDGVQGGGTDGVALMERELGIVG